MKYRTLGRTGLKVSELSLGSWTTYGGSVANADAVRIVRRAFEAGINLFDTADVYVRGAAEIALGQALAGLPREQLVIATKCMGRVWDGPLGAGLSRKHVFDAMDQSLKRLGVDYVDLYQMHAPDAGTPIEETLRAFEDLVRMGKARYVGFSTFDRDPALAEKVVRSAARSASAPGDPDVLDSAQCCLMCGRRRARYRARPGVVRSLSARPARSTTPRRARPRSPAPNISIAALGRFSAAPAKSSSTSSPRPHWGFDRLDQCFSRPCRKTSHSALATSSGGRLFGIDGYHL